MGTFLPSRRRTHDQRKYFRLHGFAFDIKHKGVLRHKGHLRKGGIFDPGN